MLNATTSSHVGNRDSRPGVEIANFQGVRRSRESRAHLSLSMRQYMEEGLLL
jgi:hypothetical protein